MSEKFQNMEKAILNDINSDLINCFKSVKTDVANVISILSEWQEQYHALSDDLEKRKEFYYSKRELYNTRQSEQVVQSALFIFLNRTCFNGLYRVNRKNEFNVPIGSYKKPQICNSENLINVSETLQNVELLCGDYKNTLDYAKGKVFFYMDPPYKPLSETSSFNSYAKDDFNDEKQFELGRFCDTLNEKGIKWLLSNSDMKNTNPDDEFFDDLYQNFSIKRVFARRNINSNASKRGELTELLIMN
jgi:DNA adenine methylase